MALRPVSTFYELFMVVWGGFHENCTQLLHLEPKLLTSFLGEEVERQNMTNFHRHLWFSSAKTPI